MKYQMILDEKIMMAEIERTIQIFKTLKILRVQRFVASLSKTDRF